MSDRAPRRVLLTAIAILCATAILRPQISSALVVRGDDLAYGGQSARARRMYGRAIALDRDNAAAVDRLAFSETISHLPALLRAATAVTSRYLSRHPHDVTVLGDRALALELLGNYTSAERDFALAGHLSRDVQSLTFAGFAALHARSAVRARKLFADALRVDSTYEPALRGFNRAR
ncbi:MAG: hypothetical protein ABI282_08695 [Candidatus Baltobacteraceae bacterium]